MSLDEAHVARTLETFSAEGDPAEFSVLADYFLERERPDLAASALDRAYGLAPDDEQIRKQRAGLLDALAVEEHGLVFRYVPAGTFLMGSETGQDDERPVHPVRLGGYWVSRAPVTWATFCDLMNWEPPPHSVPRDFDEPDTERIDRPLFYLREENKIRLQYCETQTTRAGDWHAHASDLVFTDGDGNQRSPEELFGKVPRADDSRPFEYDVKPMVAVSWTDAEALCERISTQDTLYRLPTEAQWEKAARGGLIQQTYPWGDDPPTSELCDFDHFGKFALRPPLILPPNGYGLHGMSGGVWEWTSDFYDRLAYDRDASPPADPPALRTLRGGSWADCAAAVTVSFRMSLAVGSWQQSRWGDHYSPNVGFRLCRMAVGARASSV